MRRASGALRRAAPSPIFFARAALLRVVGLATGNAPTYARLAGGTAGGAARLVFPWVARRVLEQQSGQRPLCQPQQQRPGQPQQQHRLPGGVFVHVFPFLPGPGASVGGWARPAARARPTSGVARRPRFAGRGKEGKMARARPVRTARRRRAVGRIQNRGAGWTSVPRRPTLPASAQPASDRSQPPSRRPISATSVPACWY